MCADKSPLSGENGWMGGKCFWGSAVFGVPVRSEKV